MTSSPAKPGKPRTWLGRRWEAMGSFLGDELWSKELGSLPTFRALFYKTLRVIYLATRGFHQDRCLLRASALTFMTGLSIVPLLAFAFAVAKGLGAYESLLNDVIRPFMDKNLAGTPGADGVVGGSEVKAALDQVLILVQDTRVSSLGTFGLAVLIYTIVKLLSSIEHTFNEIWGVHQSRSVMRKLSDYLSIIVIVPILLTTATAVTTSLQSESMLGFLTTKLGLGYLAAYYARFAPFLAVWVGFTFVYLFMPNTRVRPMSAILGGLVGGALWQLAQILHLRFQVGVANYNAIYSTFAALPIFMFWLYLSWTTVLLGAEVAYAHQGEPAFRQVMRARNQDHAYQEVVAVRVMGRVAVAFLGGEKPIRVDAMAEGLGVPERSIDEVLESMRAAGLIALSEVEQPSYAQILPARDLGHIRIQDVLDSLAGGGTAELPVRAAVDRETDRCLQDYLSERLDVPSNRTFRHLAEACLRSDTDLFAQQEGTSALA